MQKLETIGFKESVKKSTSRIQDNMKIALESFEQFKKDNEFFFSFDKRETLFGHLGTYAVEKQFNDSAFQPKSNYSVYVKQVNKFKHKSLFIETEDFILNLGRTNSDKRLLPVSSYKKEYAEANAGIATQLSFDFTKRVPEITEGKKYAQIIYGYSDGELKHLKVILPSHDYKNIEYSKNILDEVKEYKKYVPKDLVEESIVALKKDLAKKVE